MADKLTIFHGSGQIIERPNIRTGQSAQRLRARLLLHGKPRAGPGMGCLRRIRWVCQPLFARHKRTHGTQSERWQLHHPPLACCAAGKPNVPRLREHSALGARLPCLTASLSITAGSISCAAIEPTIRISRSLMPSSTTGSPSRVSNGPWRWETWASKWWCARRRPSVALPSKASKPPTVGCTYPRKMARDHEARAIYREELKLTDLAGDYTISDIMREDWRADDARLRRIVSE